MAERVHCDQCDVVVDPYAVRFRVEIVSELALMGRAEGPRDFCSSACLTAWAVRA